MNVLAYRYRRLLFILLLSLLPGLFHGAAAAAGMYGPNTGLHILELEGRPVAVLRSFTGGAMAGKVAVQPTPGDCCFAPKHLASVHPEDLVVEIAGNLDPNLVGWIQANLNGEPGGRGGSIVILDNNYREVRRIQFFYGVITEIKLPAFNGASRDIFALTLRITPEQSQIAKGSGQAYPVPGTRQKAGLTSNFRFDLTGIDASRVASIDAITLTRKAVDTEVVGEVRGYVSSRRPFEVSPLVLGLNEFSVGGFEAWYQNFVVKGNSGDDQEREGTLTLLTADLKTPLLTLSLHHLGLYRLTYGYDPAGRANTIRAEAYIESLSISGGTP